MVLIMLLKLHKHLFRNVLQRFEDPGSRYCNSLEKRDALRIEEFVHIFDGGDIGQVSLVILDGIRELVEVIALFGEVDPEVLEALDVSLHPLNLAVRNEYYAVDAFEDELSAGGVKDLAGDGIKMEPHLETPYVAECKRQEVKKKRTLGLGRQGDQLSLLVRIRFLIDVL